MVVGACLFPLAPYKVKLVVVYLSMGILMTLMGALLLRGAIAGATWMAFGRSFWLLPNVLSEVSQTGICQACWKIVLAKIAHQTASFAASSDRGQVRLEGITSICQDVGMRCQSIFL